jgi:hypothetical protein
MVGAPKDIARYALTSMLKNFVSGIPKRGLTYVTEDLITEVEYVGERESAATISLMDHRMNKRRYFEFTIKEKMS